MGNEKMVLNYVNKDINVFTLPQAFFNQTLYYKYNGKLYACRIKSIHTELYKKCFLGSLRANSKCSVCIVLAPGEEITLPYDNVLLYNSVEDFRNNKNFFLSNKVRTIELASGINSIVGRDIAKNSYKSNDCVVTYTWENNQVIEKYLVVPTKIVQLSNGKLYFENGCIENCDKKYSSKQQCHEENSWSVEVVEFECDSIAQNNQALIQLQEMKDAYNKLGKEIAKLEQSIS